MPATDIALMSNTMHGEARRDDNRGDEVFDEVFEYFDDVGKSRQLAYFVFFKVGITCVTGIISSRVVHSVINIR